MAENDSHTILCSSCGVMNPSSLAVCESCGTPLEFIPATSSVASGPKANKRAVAGPFPQWLKITVVVFGLYVVAVSIYEYQKLPSGSVQRNQPAAAQEVPAHESMNRISELEQHLTADPNNAELTLQFANVLHDARLFPRAIETYRRYLVLKPKDGDARVDLGICYYETGEAARAVKEIESVIASDPKHQMAAFNLGIIQLSNQNMAEAKRWLKRCVELDPQSTAGLRAQQILQQH